MTDPFSLVGTGQVTSTFRFRLLDRFNSFVADLPVEMGPSITNNVNRGVKRTMDGLTLAPSVTADVNTLTERVAPSMVTADGTEWPMGVFLFADATRRLVLSGSADLTGVGEQWWTDTTMADQGIILAQATRGPVSYQPGAEIYAAIIEQLEQGGVIDYEVEFTAATFSDWVVWAPATSRAKILNELCSMAGFYSPYFDNRGVAIARSVPTLESVEPDINYGPGDNVVADSITESDDLLDSPNVYVVTNTGFTEAPVFGEWRVPASAPNSYENIGYWRVKAIDKQGITSNAQAAAAARAEGQSDFASYRWANFATALNPLHDTFQVIGWRGVKWREQQWSTALLPAADHKHELRRIWAGEAADEIVEAA